MELQPLLMALEVGDWVYFTTIGGVLTLLKTWFLGPIVLGEFKIKRVALFPGR